MSDLLAKYDRGEITADEYIDAVAARRQMQAEESPHDFSHSGLGIGGLARHDESAEIAEMIASGQLRIVEHKPRGPMPHGQLWEPCPRCGTEPVCLDCGLCEQHCRC